MKKRLLVCIIALALVGQAQAIECNDRINSTAPASRYVLHGDGTATDTRTGLRWQRCPVGFELDDSGTPDLIADDHCIASGTTSFNWQGALQAAVDLNAAGGLAGFDDWRVPNVKELASIVEYRCFDPAINDAIFPDTQPGFFWSSTPAWRIDSALGIEFEAGEGTFSYKDLTGFEHPVRLVRGGS